MVSLRIRTGPGSFQPHFNLPKDELNGPRPSSVLPLVYLFFTQHFGFLMRRSRSRQPSLKDKLQFEKQ